MSGRRTIAVTLASLSLAVAGLLVAAGCGSPDSVPATSGSNPGPSSSAGSELVFAGTTLDGRQFDLAAYRGRPVVVNFWASWCGWCAREMPDLVKFAAMHPEAVVIGVDVNDTITDAQRFAAKYGIGFPLVADEQGAIFSRFESQGLPTTIFFDKDLNAVGKVVGATDLAGFEAGLKRAQ